MLDKKALKQVKKIAEEFFQKTTFEVEIETLKGEEEKKAILHLKTKDPQVLIGEGGRTLIDIQRVLARILKKRVDQALLLDLDINQYKKNKMKYLQELVQGVADSVVLERKERVLSPMSSYERRIVHLELAKRQDVKTESAGEGMNRRVVVKPV